MKTIRDTLLALIEWLIGVLEEAQWRLVQPRPGAPPPPTPFPGPTLHIDPVMSSTDVEVTVTHDKGLDIEMSIDGEPYERVEGAVIITRCSTGPRHVTFRASDGDGGMESDSLIVPQAPEWQGL